MGEMNYAPLISEMEWSYSRIKCFEDCPHQWFLKYIKKYPEKAQFYASYGKFIHTLIEQYYLGEIDKEDLPIAYLQRFSSEVKGHRPKAETLSKYINDGLSYLQSFQPLPFNMVAVEKHVEFEIDGYKFQGYIDYIGEKDGDLYLVDNKSRDLKPRSGRGKPTVKDRELDEYLKQLYLYSIAIKEEFGVYPKYLCFNCYRTQNFIVEPFKIDALEATKAWAIEKISEIFSESDFEPNQDFFRCYWICGVCDHCDVNIETIENWRR